MDEKTMINDILEGTKTEITAYSQAITETENMQLRNAMQQIRNSNESFQYELFKIAESKGYYEPAEEAEQTQILKVKTDLE